MLLEMSEKSRNGSSKSSLASSETASSEKNGEAAEKADGDESK